MVSEPADSITRAMPKSVRYGCSGPPRRASTRMLPGFTSRWTRPAVCAASSAEATGEMNDGDPARRQGPADPEHPLQGVARHEAHRDVLHAVGLAGRVDRDDVRVVDRRDGAGLADEPRPQRLVADQQLQRHDPVEPLVAGPVDRRHAAHADQLLDDVPGHAGTRGEPVVRAA